MNQNLKAGKISEKTNLQKKKTARMQASETHNPKKKERKLQRKDDKVDFEYSKK